MKTIEKILNPKEKVSDLSLDELIAIARNGFGTEMTREDIVNHIINIDILYLLKYKNELVGFSSYDLHEFNGNKILYLSGIVLRRDMQKNGFFKDTNKIALSEIKPKYFTMKTQNPVIYGATKNLVSKIYPNGEIIPENIKKIAGLFCSGFFDRDKLICKKNYGNCLYDKIPEYKNINDFFENTLKIDYYSGDSVVIVGEMNDS